MVKQKRPTDLAVADQAWIGCLATGIPFEKILHDRLAEDILGIDNIKGNVQSCGDATRLRHRVRCTTTIGLFLAGFTPQAEHHANDVIALLLEQGGGNRGVHSSRHGNNNFGHGDW